MMVYSKLLLELYFLNTTSGMTIAFSGCIADVSNRQFQAVHPGLMHAE